MQDGALELGSPWHMLPDVSPGNADADTPCLGAGLCRRPKCTTWPLLGPIHARTTQTVCAQRTGGSPPGSTPSVPSFVPVERFETYRTVCRNLIPIVPRGGGLMLTHLIKSTDSIKTKMNHGPRAPSGAQIPTEHFSMCRRTPTRFKKSTCGAQKPGVRR